MLPHQLWSETMSEKKDLFSFIHVYCGPRIDQTVYFLATDAGDKMQASKFITANADSEWGVTVPVKFQGLVDQRTLDHLLNQRQKIKGWLQEGSGSIWITPEGATLRTASSA